MKKNGKSILEKCPMCGGSGKVVAKTESRIRRLREKHNLTQDEFCKSLSCSRTQIANIEGGKVKGSTDLLIEIADTYKVSVDWILGRTNKI